MTINLSVPASHQLKPRITVIGAGGAGGNAVNNMITSHLEGVEFLVANTDAQALAQSLSERRIQLGSAITQGLGAGSRPDVGRAAAEEVVDEIVEQLQGTNMVFITAGMGGGTGTGAAPVIARIARDQGILTVGVVTKPFHFEGVKRMHIAEGGLAELQQYVDTLIIIPNQNLFRLANEKTTFAEAFKMADDVLYSGVRGVTDLMVMPGLINLDFADVRTVMAEMGKAMMGTGEAEGESRSIQAAEAAISNPLLDEVSMKGARGVLINITGGPDMTLYEVDEAANRIRDEVDKEANIIFGSTFEEELAGSIRVSVVATGIDCASMGMAINDAQAKPGADAGIVAAATAKAAVASEGLSANPQASFAEGAPFTASPTAESLAAAQAHAPSQPDVRPLAEPANEPNLGAGARPVAVASPGQAFVPPPPVMPGQRPNASDRAAPAKAASGVRRADKPRFPELFRAVTGVGRMRAEKTPGPVEAPARNAAPALTRQGQPENANLAPVDDEALDIPAFLRRQASHT